MNMIATAFSKRDVAHEHRGDHYLGGEDLTDTVKRVRAHLSEAFPEMSFKVRGMRDSGPPHIRISITRHKSADLSDRATGFTAKRQVEAEMNRFKRYD